MQPELEPSPEYIDLMERSSSGITVILYWLRSRNTCSITIVDVNGTSSFVPVPNDKAMDAFNHPFPYRDAYNKTKEPVELEDATEPDKPKPDIPPLY